MAISIAEWGIELAFIRTKVGEEFSVAEALAKNGEGSTCQFFGTYGYFDLVGIRTIESLNAPHLVLLHPNVTESAPFRFFADSTFTNEDAVDASLKEAIAAIAVFLKIYPCLISRDVVSVREKTAERVRFAFPQAHVFFGSGFSELLLIATGSNLALLLAEVTKLRMLADESGQYPLFSKTTTFPFVSVANAHRDSKYAALSGNMEPVVTLSCEPAAELRIAEDLNKEGITTRNIYGKSDLLLAWATPISLSQFAHFLSTFRERWGRSGAVSKTTTYLETALSAATHGTSTSEHTQRQVIKVEDEQELFVRLQSIQQPGLRGALSDVALRLLACLRDPQISDHYEDMVNTFAYFKDLVTIRLNEPDLIVRREAELAGLNIADLARSAINQRYAGLEFHPETLAHSSASLTCDIRSIVAAATCIPHFIFDNAFEGKRAKNVWAGFVLFGSGYSPRWLYQDILALPQESVSAPIQEWWKITHEVAHALFHLAEVYNAIPRNLLQLIEEVFQSPSMAYHFVNELFANWFDWRYIFASDAELYLNLIWNSWLQMPMVWKDKPQYLTRSFSLLLLRDPAALLEVSKKRVVYGFSPLLQKNWTDFIGMVKGVSKMRDFMDDERSVSDTFIQVRSVVPLLRWFDLHFENKCRLVGLMDRLNRPYEEVGLHVSALREGQVIGDTIKNPFRLHIEILKSLKGDQPTIAMEMAYVYSMENTYIATRSD